MSDWAVLTIIFLLILGLTLLAVYAIYLIAPQAPTEAKRRRYEAGNPPQGEAKSRLAMQYFGYVLMLVTLEPLIAVPIVYFAISPSYASAIYLLVIVALIVIAAMYAYAHSRDIRKWILD
ncbi:MAG: NADH-quinone oxidoreductase subunit A [Thermoproteus sp.]